VKSGTSFPEEKVKSETPKLLQSLEIMPDKVLDTKEREKKGAPPAPFSLSPHEDTDMPGSTISPEVARKFGLCYTTENWPPRRREKD
jgi:hypothetical protein